MVCIKIIGKVLKITVEIIVVIIILIIGYQIIRQISGGTWKTENIIISTFGIIMAGIFVVIGVLINQAKSLEKLEERTYNLGNSLSSLGKDFKEHLIQKHKKE